MLRINSIPNSPDDEFLKPYKGPQSYQVEDRSFFHGRETEAEHLIARILSSRFTLLHAQSGAGKTSLLNACIIPGLEARGWFPVRVVPQNDPVSAIRSGCLQYLFPPPEAEVLVIERACNMLGLSETNASIANVIAAYDALPKRDPRKREIVAPIESDELASRHPITGRGRITPYSCRVLRASLDLETASEQWNLVRALAAQGGELPPPLSEWLVVSELIGALQAPKFMEAYRSLVALMEPPGNPGLSDFFVNLVMMYGSHFSRFGLVILMDQFEEMFTRFVDLGPTASITSLQLPDWRLRWELFRQLELLYATEATVGGVPGSSGPLPIRVVLSMRSEYIGKLDSVRAFVPSLDLCTYHLELLPVEAAATAIKEPAREFGYGYATECYDRIVADLRKEDRYIEPTHLQVVCEHLWNARGRKLGQQGLQENGELPLLPLELYEREEGVQGIMSKFLGDFLDSLEKVDRIEILGILEELITPSGTRNIVEREYLVSRPLRNRDRRSQLLANLVNRAIVRAETRLGGQFVEITHEFLIAPIKRAIQEELFATPEYKRLGLALLALERLEDDEGSMGTGASLMRWEFDAIDAHASELAWPEWAVERMFRNAIALEASHTTIRCWAGKLEGKEGTAA